MLTLRLATALTLASVALAQGGTIVSPNGAATVEGSGSNSFPFSSTVQRRYLQLHSDLGTTPRVITQLSFRVTAATTNYTGTRVHDLELYMGHGRHALSPSWNLDANYIGGKTLMIPRSLITFGPTGQAVSPGPNPFTGAMDLILPQPFVYNGNNSLVWELAYYGNTSSGTNGTVDAEQGVVTAGTSTITGTGCTALGNTAPMTHTFTCHDIAGTLSMNSTVTAGPVNSACFLAVGFSNPMLTVPGLCSTVYTDAVLTQFMGFTDGAGAMTTSNPAGATIVIPNFGGGVPLTSQVFALDLGRPDPIEFCASNGRQVTTPAPNTTRVNLATRIFNNAGGTTATDGVYFTSCVGYALVTQFTHL